MPQGKPPPGGGSGPGKPVPRLHLVTDDRILKGPRFRETALEVADVLSPGDGFSAAVHLRGPGLSGRELFSLGRDVLPRLRERGVSVLVNDRGDVAAALGADGVHLAARSLPGDAVRRWWGAAPLVGRSVHDPATVPGRPELGSLDYLMVGTLWRTASHPGRPGAGPRRIAQVAEAVAASGGAALPLIGIGGIGPSRVRKVLDHGGYGVAVLGAVWDAGEPALAAERFRGLLSDGHAPVADVHRAGGGGNDEGGNRPLDRESEEQDDG